MAQRPIGLDATSNGYQHLAWLARDAKAAARVNLFDSDSPKDPYGDVAKLVLQMLKDSDAEPMAGWTADVTAAPGLDECYLCNKLNNAPTPAPRMPHKIPSPMPPIKFLCVSQSIKLTLKIEAECS